MPAEKKTKKNKSKADEPEQDALDAPAAAEGNGDAETMAMLGEKKKKKKNKDDDNEADEPAEKEKEKEKEKKNKKEKKEKRKPTPLVCTVVNIQPVPKKDKLRICTIRFMEDMDPVDVVTNAPNVCVAGKFLVALPGVTVATGVEIKETTVAGVASVGMFCGPKEMGWETDVLDPDLAVMLDDAAEIGTTSSYEDAVKAFQERENAEAAKAEAVAVAKAKGKKGKKGKADKEEEEDLDALLEEAGLRAEPEAKAESKKKGKKGKQAKQDDEDDAIFEEFKEKPKPEAQPEEKVVEAAASKEETTPEKSLDAPQAPEKKQDEDMEEEGDEAVDAKTLANRKKKDKKKQKQQAVGGGGFFKDDDAADAAPSAAAASSTVSEEAAASTVAASSKGKAAPKKESAAVKAARERMEAQKKLDEEREAHYAQEKARIEEEERIEREEQERLEAERERKRQARQAKVDRQKAEGTYQTKTQKLRAARAAQLREQFGFNLEDLDEQDDDEEASKPPAKAKRGPVATKKKKRVAANQDETSAEPTPVEAEEKPAPVVEEKKEPIPEVKAEDEEEGDDWEAQADEKEEEGETAYDKPDEEEKNDDDDDDDSGSEDDSSSSSDSDSSSDFMGYRSPIVCIMGHVDTGKTLLLDKIRKTKVQENEAGGITQQIGATFFPDIALEKQTKKVDEDFDVEVPGLLVIDTPGHESFNNLRKRGSSLCDIAILVIDLMHGLEPQTVESLEMLKIRKCPFIVAMNKIDRCAYWKSEEYTGIRDALDRQKDDATINDFNARLAKVKLELNQRGLNCDLYWENQNLSSTISIVPTSAMTGEGVPDLLYLLIKLSQTLFPSQLEVINELQCTVIEVKNIEGHGTTIDVVLVNGTLNEGDRIVIAGMGGPIVTTIRALMTPAALKEMRVKSEYMHHQKISMSMGVKISAPGLEEAVAGTELKVIGPDDDVEELKEEVQDGFESILNDIDKAAAGVYVKASTLGSLEALLSFLYDQKIPVFDVSIGEVHKKDVKRTLIMKEKGHPEYAVILAFDVKVNPDAKKQADEDGVQIMTADIIYHLEEKFKTYMKGVEDAKKQATRAEAVFPVIMQIDKQYVFHQKDPIIFGVKVLGGQLRPGTPICVPDKEFLEIGRVGSIEKDKREVKTARNGESVCVRIDQNTQQNHIAFGRHFNHTNRLYSKVSRASIDVLKENFKEEMKKEDWEALIGMKSLFKIQ